MEGTSHISDYSVSVRGNAKLIMHVAVEYIIRLFASEGRFKLSRCHPPPSVFIPEILGSETSEWTKRLGGAASVQWVCEGPINAPAS